MIYTASDAIDLAYRIIGKTSASYLNNKYDATKFRLMAMDIKEFYRSAIKNKIKSRDEFDKHFNAFVWTFLGTDSDRGILIKIKEFIMEVFFIKNDTNYWIDRRHAIDELKKIYDIALENSFVVDKDSIDWTKTVRIIESRFLNFINNKNLIFDNELKGKLRNILEAYNENDEINYVSKCKLAFETFDTLQDFVERYESDLSLQKNLKFQRDYETIKKMVLQFKNLFPEGRSALQYENLLKMVDDLPEDILVLSISQGQELLKRIFYADYLYTHVTTASVSLVNTKISLITEIGGWKMDLEKPELYNTFIALTQPRSVIEREIKQDDVRLNDDISEVCLRLIALSLKSVTPEKFVNIENNTEYEIPNKKIVSVFMYELCQLIKYHESGGQLLTTVDTASDNLPGNPVTHISNSSASSKANNLLDFEHVSGIITALKSGHSDIQDYPDTVIMRTIKFISKLGEIDVL